MLTFNAFDTSSSVISFNIDTSVAVLATRKWAAYPLPPRRFTAGSAAILGSVQTGGIFGSRAGLWIAAIAFTLVLIAWVWASPFTLKNPRLVQRVGTKLVGHGWAEAWDVCTQYTEADISPRLWPNGTIPVSEEFKSLLKRGFSEYKLRVDGLVEEPKEFSYVQIKAMRKQEQITCHFCVQGWSGVAKWTGVPMRHILDLVKPKREAKYVVFYSFAESAEGGRYYDVHRLHNMRHELSLLAYEMNGQPLTVLHGAPLRLRCENELGFKMVKWIEAIEFVESFDHLGAGQGGYREDHEFVGYRMPI